MEKEYIVYLVSMLITLILGHISKKSDFISNNLIPIQNLLIGVVICLIEWLITKDFSIALAFSGLMAGGSYDIIHNLNKIKQGNKEWEEHCEEKIGE